MSSFFGSLFGGQNSTLSSGINQTGSLAGFSSNLGQQNTSAGSGFFNSLLSGDPSKIATTLAPEISAMQQSGQQQKSSAAIFGNRSGGTNAKAQGIDSGNRANLTNLIGGLQSGAASTLLGSGQSLLNTSLGALGEQSQMSIEQMNAWKNSILGQGLTGGLLGGEGIGLASAGKAAGVAGLFGG